MSTLELVCNFNFNTGLVQGKNTMCALLTCVYIASYNKRLNEIRDTYSGIGYCFSQFHSGHLNMCSMCQSKCVKNGVYCLLLRN